MKRFSRFWFISLSTLLILTWFPAFAQQRGQSVKNRNNRWALVIGNGAYETAPLNNAVNDARDMAQALRDMGFDVIESVNQNRRQMTDSIRIFGGKLKAGGVGLFYFAGHGMQVDGKNYLIPTGSDIRSEGDIEFEAVDVNRVMRYMADAGNRPNIVILDACRNNPFARSFRSSSNGLAFMDAPGGMIIAYSTAPGRVASDGTGRNGIYTAELLRQIRTQGLDIKDIFMRVTASVESKTNRTQVPWQSMSITEPFYFSGGQTGYVPSDAAKNSRPRERPSYESQVQKKPPPPSTKSAEADFIRLDLLSCRISGKTIVCEFSVTNTDTRDNKFEILYGTRYDSSKAWDNLGNQYGSSNATLANQRGGGLVTIGTSPRLRLIFTGSESGATSLSKVLITGSTSHNSKFSVTFRDICLTDNCQNTSSNEDQGAASRSFSSESGEKNLTLQANQQWIDSGIDVQPGMQLTVSASGTISLGSGRRCDANGAPGVGLANLTFPMRNAYMGALIAKIRYPNGKDSKKVKVGVSNTLRIEENESGRLFFGINDLTLSDNKGVYRIAVRW